MKLKRQIKLTFLLDLNPDRIQEALDDGFGLSDVEKELRDYDLDSRYIDDWEVYEVEPITE